MYAKHAERSRNKALSAIRRDIGDQIIDVLVAIDESAKRGNFGLIYDIGPDCEVRHKLMTTLRSLGYKLDCFVPEPGETETEVYIKWGGELLMLGDY